MTDLRRCTLLFMAFLPLVNAAGLHVHRDDIGVRNSGKDEATIANLSLRNTQELSEKLRVKLSTPWMKLALRHSMLTPFRVLNDVVMQNNETRDVGANASDFAQVSLSSSSGRSWCIAKSRATPDAVQTSLNWACGFGGADCGPIQLGNPCFIPNTVYSHASYAFNSYYQIHQHASETCDFDGTATVVYEDPSYSGCPYPFRSGQPGATPVGEFINEAGRSSISSSEALAALYILLPIRNNTTSAVYISFFMSRRANLGAFCYMLLFLSVVRVRHTPWSFKGFPTTASLYIPYKKPNVLKIEKKRRPRRICAMRNLSAMALIVK